LNLSLIEKAIEEQKIETTEEIKGRIKTLLPVIGGEAEGGKSVTYRRTNRAALEEYLVGEYANAWHLTFHEELSEQGFYRIWDSTFEEITDAMKNDLLRVANTELDS